MDDNDLKSRLLKSRIGEDVVPIEGVGEVRVRGLSRGEVFMMQKARADGGIKTEAAWEQRLLHLALVDPAMTEDEVGEWQRNSPAGEIEPVAEKVKELSALAEGADKSGVSGVRDDTGSGVRVLPGDEAEHVGGDVEGAAV